MRVQKKHMYTHPHTSRQDAAESHRHQEYKSQPFACIISEISEALLLHKAELFKTNMEKQDCTLKMRKKNRNITCIWANQILFHTQLLTKKVYNPDLTSPRAAIFQLTGWQN